MQDQDVGQRPEGDLLRGVVLLQLAVGAEPGVLTIELGGGRREKIAIGISIIQK